jgi:hypothetical protein
MLQEEDWRPPSSWELPAASTIVAVSCETAHAVDDVELRLAPAGRILIQAKRSLVASSRVGSPLYKAVEQLVREYLRAERDGRPLNPSVDRLIIATSRSASRPIWVGVPAVLERLRSDSIPLPDVRVISQAERNGWSALLECARTAFAANGVEDVSDEVVVRFLHVVRLEVLDAETDGEHHRESIATLRRDVLEAHTDAAHTWAQLVELFLTAAARHLGFERRVLQRRMGALGLGLQANPSVRVDVARLGRVTSSALERLRPHASLVGPGDGARITRDCEAVLTERAKRGSLFIVGEPGIGKTALLVGLAERLRDEGSDVVLVSVQDHAFSDVRGLEVALDLENDLVEVLMGWASSETARFLLLDGLDAARGTGTASLAQLVRTLSADSRWIVVASVRTFDLRHDRELQDAMSRSEQHEDAYIRSEFRQVRHFEVPALSSAELAQVQSVSPILHRVLERAPAGLRELARVPFNLDLLARLVQAGEDQSTLAPIGTQLQLLAAYWQQRVRRPPERHDVRERSARAVCQAALGAMRLQANRLEVSEPDGLDDLLREGVLTSRASGMDEFVGFAHNLLFDYAFAALMIDPSPKPFLEIARRPDVLLLARPSVALRLAERFEREASRESFWSIFAGAAATVEQSDPLPMIIAALAVELIDRFEDLAPLIDALQEADASTPEAIARHLTGALLSSQDLSRRLSEVSNLTPWVSLVEVVSKKMRDSVEYPVRALIGGLLAERERLSPGEMRLLASAGRCMLAWALDCEPAPEAAVHVGIDACAQLIENAPEQASSLLRRLIAPDRLRVYGYRELRLIGERIPEIVRIDPALGADVFIEGFRNRESSEEPVPMGGQIIGMQSNRRQDYDMALYSLAEQAPALLASDPREAARALAAVADSVHRVPWRETRPATGFTMRWRGQVVEVVEDGSGMWDTRVHPGDNAERIIDAFEKHVVALTRGRRRDDLDGFLDALALNMLPAVLVRRLLSAAADASRVLASRVAELLSQSAVLASTDLNGPASAALKPCFAVMSKRDRRRIERAILDLCNSTDEGIRRQGTHLLASLPAERIVTASVQQASSELEEVSQPESMVPGAAVWTGDQGWQDPDEKPDSAAETALRQATERLAGLMRGSDGRPVQVSNAKLAAGVRYVQNARVQVLATGTTARSLHEADARMAEAAERILTTWPLRPTSGPVRLAREVALESAGHELPADDLDDTDDDHDFWGWGWPAVRRDAVEALALLTREPKVATDATRSAIRQLARDPSAIVRDGLAVRLDCVLWGDEALAWELSERIAREEESSAVQRHMLSTVLSGLLHRDQDRAVALLAEMGRRERGGRRRKGLLAVIGGWFLELYFHLGRDEGRVLADELVADPLAEEGLAEAHWGEMRETVCAGSIGDEAGAAVRARALRWQAAVVREVASGIDEIVGSGGPGGDEERAHRLQGLLRLADRAAAEAYFASGSFRADDDDDERALEPAVRERFWDEASELLDALCRIGWARAAHHVVQTLATFVDFDPHGAWRRLTRVLEVAAGWGYQNESLAVGEFMTIIRRYLASYRDIVLDDPEGRAALIATLVSFARVGWPEPHRLLIGLDDMFR